MDKMQADRIETTVGSTKIVQTKDEVILKAGMTELIVTPAGIHSKI
ncbi:hypothetical protein [Aeribacillus composti]|jgi:hypothetical protein|nr:hypothetical protein [Aeribacillus composti]